MTGSLSFVVICGKCSEALAVVPVEGDEWRQAEAWCYLAARTHTCQPREVRASRDGSAARECWYSDGVPSRQASRGG